MNDENLDGWRDWSKFVLHELERLNDCYDALRKQQEDIRLEIRELKVKSGIWGFVAGAVPVCITLAVILIKTHLG